MWPWCRIESDNWRSPSSSSGILFCQGATAKGQVCRGTPMASRRSHAVTGIGKSKPTACVRTCSRAVSNRDSASSTFSWPRRLKVSKSIMQRVEVSTANAPNLRAKPRMSNARPVSWAPAVALQRPSRSSVAGTSRAIARAAQPSFWTTAGAICSCWSSVPALQMSISCIHTRKG